MNGRSYLLTGLLLLPGVRAETFAFAPRLKPVSEARQVANRRSRSELRLLQATQPTAQHQPGRNSPEVLRELDLLFQEDGTAMPSMRPSELPNAHLRGAVRRRSDVPEQPKGLLGRLMRRFRRGPRNPEASSKSSRAAAIRPSVSPGARFRQPGIVPPTRQNGELTRRVLRPTDIQSGAAKPGSRKPAPQSSRLRPNQAGTFGNVSDRATKPAVVPSGSSPASRVVTGFSTQQTGQRPLGTPTSGPRAVPTKRLSPPDDFESPFSALSESEADDFAPSPETAEQSGPQQPDHQPQGLPRESTAASAKQNPFTGVTLEPEAKKPATISTPNAAPSPAELPSTGRKTARQRTFLPQSQAVASAPPAAAPPEMSVEEKFELIASRRGLTGFRGFCPVALRDHRELLDTRPAFNAVFGPGMYHFSSAEARAMFVRNPARYTPAANGADIVMLRNSGREIEGSIEFSAWYKSRLYLFSSRSSLERFIKTPAKFVDETRD